MRIIKDVEKKDCVRAILSKQSLPLRTPGKGCVDIDTQVLYLITIWNKSAITRDLRQQNPINFVNQSRTSNDNNLSLGGLMFRPWEMLHLQIFSGSEFIFLTALAGLNSGALA